MIKRFIKMVRIQSHTSEYRDVVELDNLLKPIEDQVETKEFTTNGKNYVWVKFKNNPGDWIQHDPRYVAIDKFYVYNWTETHYKYFNQLLQKRLE